MKKEIKDFLLYVIVGGVATVVEWVAFYLLNTVASIHYEVAVTLAYILSTFVNWLVGRLLVFKDNAGSIVREIVGVYLASVVGLLLNLGIMWVAVSVLSFNEMISKIVATGIVFIYNFAVRKLVIYRKKA